MKKMRRFTKSKTIQKIWHILVSLQTPEDVSRFMEDLFTPSEVSMAGQRLLIATMLHRELKYEEIVDKTGAIRSTIHEVWKVLHRGTGGYEVAFSALQQEQERKDYHRREYHKSPEQRYIEHRLQKGK